MIAIDIPGLTPLLRAVGPLKVEGLDKPVTANNAGTVLLRDLYADVPANANAQADFPQLLFEYETFPRGQELAVLNFLMPLLFAQHQPGRQNYGSGYHRPG